LPIQKSKTHTYLIEKNKHNKTENKLNKKIALKNIKEIHPLEINPKKKLNFSLIIMSIIKIIKILESKLIISISLKSTHKKKTFKIKWHHVL
jgi:hypothetical protein